MTDETKQEPSMEATPDKGPQQETPPQPDPKPSPERVRPDTDRTPTKSCDSDTLTAEKRADLHDLALTLQCADLYHFTTTAGPWPD